MTEPTQAQQAVWQWFHEPLPDFEGKTPAAMIAEGQADDVARYLRARAQVLMERSPETSE